MDASERAAAGRAARSEVRRSDHGRWAAASDRADPVAILEGQERNRVPELVPIRHGRMAASPFAFFRGAAAVMAADLAGTPATGFRVQACGDAHLANFGVFAAPDRQLVFDLNDFDESLPGPWEWDLKRLAASLAVAGRERGDDREHRQAAVSAAAASYREAIREFASQTALDVWYARMDVDSVLREIEADEPAAVRKFRRGIVKAERKTSVRAMERLTEEVDGEPRIVSQPPLVVPIDELLPKGERGRLEGSLQSVFVGYRATLAGDRQHLLDRYEFRHLARKVVGVGSVGTRCWIALLTADSDSDPLFLQAKEAEPSVLERYAGASRYRSHARRVVEGQRLMQAASDIFLGWAVATGIDGRDRDFYVRQLWDWKRSVEYEKLKPSAFSRYGAACGWTLARAHARSGDAVAIGAYLGSGETFDRALAAFAEAYADQNERDHAAFVAAIDAGRLEATAGV